MQNVSKTILALSLGTDRARVVKYLSHAPTAARIEQFATPAQVAGFNQKGAMRYVQACDFIATGDRKSLDKGSAMIVALIALAAQRVVLFSDARYLMGESVADAQHVGGVSRARLHRFIGRVGTTGTVRSKLSRTVSSRGFLSAMGVTRKGTPDSFEVCDGATSHPFIVGYAARIEELTDGDLALLLETGE